MHIIWTRSIGFWGGPVAMLLAPVMAGLHRKWQQQSQQHERQPPTQDAEPKSRSIAHHMPVLDVYQCIPQVFGSALSSTYTLSTNFQFEFYTLCNISPHVLWFDVESDMFWTKNNHLSDWLHAIRPQYFTRVFLNKLSRDALLSFVFLATGLLPTDKLPSQLILPTYGIAWKVTTTNWLSL